MESRKLIGPEPSFALSKPMNSLRFLLFLMHNLSNTCLVNLFGIQTYEENMEQIAVGETGLMSVTDQKGRRLTCMLTLGKAPANAPILIRFHGWNGNMLPPEHKINTQFQGHKNWNIIAPLDRFGWNRQGSWWLGENGDFFMPDLIDQLVSTIRTTYSLQGELYAYGSSMGGFGATVHGLRQRCGVLVLNVPQTHITHPTFGTFNKKKVDYIVGASAHEKIKSAKHPEGMREELALSTYMTNTALQIRNLPDYYKPVIYLFQTRFDPTDGDEVKGNTYFRHQTMNVVYALIDKNIPLELEVKNSNGHYVHWNWKDAIDKIEATIDTT